MLKNKEGRKIAVALSYDKEKDIAPRVISKGYGIIAEGIVQIAEENNIPIENTPELASILSVVEVNHFIPLEAYAVVAEILSYVYQKKKS